MAESLQYKIELDATNLDAGKDSVEKFGNVVKGIPISFKSGGSAAQNLGKSIGDMTLSLKPVPKEIDKLSDSMSDGSHAMRVYSSSSGAIANIMRGDFTGAMMSAGAALNSFKSIMTSMKFTGILGIVASVIASAFLLYEKSCNKALESTKKLNEAWAKARSTLQSLFLVSPEKRAKEMMSAGDMYGLVKASKDALKRYDDAANRFLDAKEKWEDAIARGDKNKANNVLAAEMERAGAAIKTAKDELDTFNNARDELTKKRAEEAFESEKTSRESLASDTSDIEMMKADKDGPEAVEALHRKRASEARIESVYFMGSNRTVQAQAEKAKLEKIALENEAAADRIKADREAGEQSAADRITADREAGEQSAAQSKESYRKSKLTPEQKAIEIDVRMKAISAKGPAALPEQQKEYWELASENDELKKAIEDNTKAEKDKRFEAYTDAEKKLSDMRKPVKKSIGYSEMFERMYATQGLFIGMKGRQQTAFGRRNERFQKSRDPDRELLDYNKEQARLLKIIALNSQGIQ